MKKLERYHSHSWWWDSHNSPKSSRWLQSNLQVDEKVKQMLKLIEEDADSFAERAKMYYQRRPELLNLVEEFYRGYRSLAERYDHLTGEIKNNIPRALQVQYGLSCESPQTASVGSHSPLRKGHQVFGHLLKEGGQSKEQMQAKIPDVGTGTCEEAENHFSADEEVTSSDSEVDDTTAIINLQQESQSLEKQNKMLAQNLQQTVERNATMQIRIKGLQDDNASLEEEANLLRNKVNKLNKDISILQREKAIKADELLTECMQLKETHPHMLEKYIVQGDSDGIESTSNLKSIDMVNCPYGKIGESISEKVFRNLEHKTMKFTEENQRVGAAADPQMTAMTASRFYTVKEDCSVEKNMELREECSAKLDNEDQETMELLKLRKENITLKNELNTLQCKEDQTAFIAWKQQQLEDLHGQLTSLVEENRKQKLALLDREEEKREVIRQLCYSMDVLNSKNHRLMDALAFTNKKLHNSCNFKLPAWKKVILGCFAGSEDPNLMR